MSLARTRSPGAPRPRARPTAAARWHAAAVLLGGLLALPAPARAEDEEARFKAIYEAAFAKYSEGLYDEALAGFEAAYAIVPAPEALFSIARCHDQAGRVDRAAAAYERYLEEAPSHEGVSKARAYLFAALRKIGEARLAAGDAAGARDAFSRAAGLDVPAAVRAAGAGVAVRVGLGDALARLGDTAGARLAYERASAEAVTAAERGLVDRRLDGLVGAPRKRRGSSRTIVIAGVVVGGVAALIAAGVAIGALASRGPRPETVLGWMEARY